MVDPLNLPSEVEDRVLGPSEFEAELRGPRWQAGHIVRLLVLALTALLVLGNAAILGASIWAQRTAPAPTVPVPVEVAEIYNFRAVDEHLWRGAVPSDAQYRALAAAGVSTIVDLRAEHGIDAPTALLAESGVDLVRIPVHDGQAPDHAQVEQFLDVVSASGGTVFVHCGAGVGRTGTMVAAYRASHGVTGWAAVRSNLAVGPPSLEQLAFAASASSADGPSRPGPGLVALSRVLDAPRRIWKVIEGL